MSHLKNSKWVYFTNYINGNVSDSVYCYDTTGKFYWSINLDTSWHGAYAPYEAGDQSIYCKIVLYSNNRNLADNGIRVTRVNTGGAIIWTQQLIKNLNHCAYAAADQILVDKEKNILLTLTFDSTGSFSIQNKTYQMTLPGLGTLVALKFDSAGNLLWYQPIYHMGSLREAVMMKLDSSGNIYGYGEIPGQSAYPTYLKMDNNTYGTGNFLFKMDGKTGKMIWFKHFSGNFRQISNWDSQCIDEDKNGCTYISGSVQGTASLGGKIITGGNNFSPFVAKFDSSGHVVWARAFVSDLRRYTLDYGIAISLDGAGNLMMTGNFGSELIIGTDTLSVPGNPALGYNAIYLVKLDTGGHFVWSKAIDYLKEGNKYPNDAGLVPGISADRDALYFSGYYRGAVTLDTFHLKTSSPHCFINGKIVYTSIISDSFQYRHAACTDSPYAFRLYAQVKPDSVRWDFGDGGGSSLQAPVHSYAATGRYTVKLTEYIKGKTRVYTRNIVYFFLPAAKVLPADTTLCTGATWQIHVPGPDTARYQWSDGDSLQDKTLKKAGVYRVTVSAGGCQVDDSMRLGYDRRSLSLGADTILCSGEVSDLHAPAWSQANTWSDSTHDSLLQVNREGSYALEATDSLGCSFGDTVKVQYALFPGRLMPEDTDLCSNGYFYVDIPGFAGSIHWQDGSAASPYRIGKAGLYRVQLSNRCGVKNYTMLVKDSDCSCYLFAPDAFSPDNDSINDRYAVQVSCPPELFDMQVYNRWGELIYRSVDATSPGWDGSYKGHPCAEGVYLYRIFYKFPHAGEQQKSGTITLLK